MAENREYVIRMQTAMYGVRETEDPLDANKKPVENPYEHIFGPGMKKVELLKAVFTSEVEWHPEDNSKTVRQYVVHQTDQRFIPSALKFDYLQYMGGTPVKRPSKPYEQKYHEYETQQYEMQKHQQLLRQNMPYQYPEQKKAAPTAKVATDPYSYLRRRKSVIVAPREPYLICRKGIRDDSDAQTTALDLRKKKDEPEAEPLNLSKRRQNEGIEWREPIYPMPLPSTGTLSSNLNPMNSQLMAYDPAYGRAVYQR